ncbi:MAG: hypothetical protein K9H61_14455, partial [Bacteroidia bacterium]|nr:hypothetical protein [Bacteroidia bacterium]
MKIEEWVKLKGYLHITAQIKDGPKLKKHIKNIKNPGFVANYAFYPLVFKEIIERKYKIYDKTGKLRSHSKINEKGVIESAKKKRPLHYATHFDALIFSFYGHLIQKHYEALLSRNELLNNAVTAYRKVPIEGTDKNKSNIHFAKDVFDEIKYRSALSETYVLAFDIKSFFSRLNHLKLKKAWENLFGFEILPDDHYNVYKAATKFSYIRWDDLKRYGELNKSSFQFDEKRLARNRNKYGIFSFFSGSKEFREIIKERKIRVYKNQFQNKKKEKNKFGTIIPVGIPQGLPLSAILANLYLLSFDTSITEKLVSGMGCFYRRYSDDIIIICTRDQVEFVSNFILNEINNSDLEISKEKTETFKFDKINNSHSIVLSCEKEDDSGKWIKSKLLYLGFEFDGSCVLVKSSNLSKYYRRLILSVKTKVARAVAQVKDFPDQKPVVYRRQLRRLYDDIDLSKHSTTKNFKNLVQNDRGGYKLEITQRKLTQKGSYHSYVKRASEIMEEPKIIHQLRSNKRILNEAINRRIKKWKN